MKIELDNITCPFTHIKISLYQWNVKKLKVINAFFFTSTRRGVYSKVRVYSFNFIFDNYTVTRKYGIYHVWMKNSPEIVFINVCFKYKLLIENNNFTFGNILFMWYMYILPQISKYGPDLKSNKTMCNEMKINSTK